MTSFSGSSSDSVAAVDPAAVDLPGAGRRQVDTQPSVHSGPDVPSGNQFGNHTCPALHIKS